jgi:hypothetical protein
MLLDEVHARIRRLNTTSGRRLRRFGATEIEVFLSHLAIAGKESASTRNPVKCVQLLFYRQVLEIDEPRLTDVASVRQGKRLPGLLTTVR